MICSSESISREDLIRSIEEKITSSGLFTIRGIRQYIEMLCYNDELLDPCISNIFLIRDGMKNHSYEVVSGFVRTLPVNML